MCWLLMRTSVGERRDLNPRPSPEFSPRRTDTPKIVDWYMDGKIAIDPMITHRLSLEDINKGFDLMHAGESIRSVVVY